MALTATIVVPTLGRSPVLADCLRALRAEGGRGVGATAEIVLVEQGPEPLPVATTGREVDRRIHVPRPLGFAAAVNLGIAAAATPWVAVVNDDAEVEPGWLGALVAALESAPRAASAQGVNLLPGEPPRVDGRGLAWNRWLQAVQLGHGEPPPPPEDGDGVREVFGVSATAALYRREALLAVARPPRREPAPGVAAPAEVFDSRLGTYYEDADLAARLRAAGHTALSVSAARVRHAGSLTAGSGVARWRQVYGNRYLVVAGLLGRRFRRVLPRMVLRDLLDLARAAAAGDLRRAAGIKAGWGRAARRLRAFRHRGAPLLGPEALVVPAPLPAEAP